MTASMLYVTVPTREEAETIASTLVEERYAACVNIHGPITSFYEWKDEVQADSELVLIVKTQARLQERVTDRIVELHSYECPCVLNLPVHSGLNAYLEWISDQTQAQLEEG
jgi:periplasmic divalent cation tolerance protein